ncbi:LysR substrate-binding domain-containing protein [Nonomuraea salmonea]|uniref:LysR substrate-binding domain-containing protein n=1 Tax=Nonomuraea salmonea TaxID=46181 RepID=UPI0031EDB548
MPDAISLLGRRHAGIDVRLREAEPPQALALLEAGEVDVAVTFTHTADPIAGEQGAGPGLVRVVVGG